MKRRIPLPSNIEITRAIFETHWDPGKGRFSSDLFKSPNTSVSHLKASNLNELIKIYHRDLDRKHRQVLWVGQLRIGTLRKIGLRHNGNPVRYKVVADPLPNNPDHAEIVNRSSKGLALAITRHLLLYFAPVREWQYKAISSSSRYVVKSSQIKAARQYNRWI